MVSSKKYNFRVLERLVRGFSNHRRLEILFLLELEPELSVDEIAQRLKVNLKTVSAHTRILTIAGLLHKRSHGNEIRHKLTPRAERVIKFCRILE